MTWMMLVTDESAAADPIAPATRRVAGLLAREKTGEILAHLHRRPYRSASEIARLEDIHVATAQRYLKELVEAGLLGCRIREGAARPTDEYWLLRPKITLTVDLDQDPAPTATVLAEAARRIGVTHAFPGHVVYDTDPRSGAIDALLVLSSRQPRQVEKRVRLPGPIGRFLAQVPSRDGQARSVYDVVQRAKLDDGQLDAVLAAVGRLRIRDEPGIARLDDGLDALLHEAAHNAPPGMSGMPPVPILRLTPFTTTTRQPDTKEVAR